MGRVRPFGLAIAEALLEKDNLALQEMKKRLEETNVTKQHRANTDQKENSQSRKQPRNPNTEKHSRIHASRERNAPQLLH